MCPSSEVDQAWHLHLAQTRSYQKMCEEVLGRCLHHDKSREGPREAARAPGDVQGHLAGIQHHIQRAAARRHLAKSMERRFGPTPAPVREDVVADPTFPARSGLDVARSGRDGGGRGVFATPVGHCDGLADCERRGNRCRLPDRPGSDGRNPGRASQTPQCRRLSATGPQSYEVAWLAGGQERVVGTALASLVDRGLLAMEVQKKDDKITGGTCRRTETAHGRFSLHDVERACLAAIPTGNVDMDRIRQVASDRLG